MSRRKTDARERDEAREERKVSLVDEIPTVIREDTFFWSPRWGAWARRYSERQRRAEFESWYEKVRHILEREGITVEFEYRETTSRVYKRVTVMRNGKRSNMTAVINALWRAEARNDEEEGNEAQ